MLRTFDSGGHAHTGIAGIVMNDFCLAEVPVAPRPPSLIAANFSSHTFGRRRAKIIQCSLWHTFHLPIILGAVSLVALIVFGALSPQVKEAAHLAGHIPLGAEELAAEVEAAFTIGVAFVTDTLGHMHRGDVAVVIRNLS